MLFSMTGFGEAHCETETFRVAFRIRSVNNKALDLQIKLPLDLSYLENQLRKIAKNIVFRGRIEVSHEFEILDPELKPPVGIDRMRLAQIIQLAQDVSVHDGVTGTLDINTVVRLPDLMVERRLGFQFPKEVEQKILDTFSQAMDRLCESRKQEGEYLLSDLMGRVQTLEDEVGHIEKLVMSRGEELRELILKRISILDADLPLDENRLAHEVVFYADRLDISEEITRLKAHVQTMRLKLNDKTQPKGRALEFLMQEKFREVTTIGNKVKLLDAANKVVLLKTECEKMKEQLFNVE